MRCPTCGVENQPEAQFCVNCGIPLETRNGEGQSVIYCTSCGSENPSGARFCIRCGAEMQSPAERGVPPGGGVPFGVPGQATDNLIPRDLGSLLSETFRVYGGSFRILVLIALLAQIPSLIAGLVLIPGGVIMFILAGIAGLAGIVLYILVQGAIISAVASQYLEREISVGGCYGAAARRFWSLLGAGIVFAAILLISLLPVLIIAVFFHPLVIVIGIPLFFYFLVRWWFYAQAIMLEGKGPLSALRRSGQLVGGSWWRVFGIGIIFVIMLLIMNLIVGIPGFIAVAFSPIVGNILFNIASSIVLPLGYIGATLVYFDLRIREEGYTLEMMASEVVI